MKTKRINKKLIIITYALKKQVPASALEEANTAVFITVSLIIPWR